MANLTQCDFCKAISTPETSTKFTNFTVSFKGTYGYAARSYDMCGGCQDSRGIVKGRTKGPEEKATLDEVLRNFISEEVQDQIGSL